MRRCPGAMLCLLLTTQWCLGQSLADTAAKIQKLSSGYQQILDERARHELAIRANCRGDTCPETVYRALDTLWTSTLSKMDALADQIHVEVDQFVIRNKDLSRTNLQQSLDEMFASGTWGADAAALHPNSSGARAIVAYTLDKGGWHGPGATSFRLRAYETRGGHLTLADSTGEDFDGYAGITVKQFSSSYPEATWFIVSGSLTGANGPQIRMRGYQFKAGKFRTKWMPGDAWGDFKIGVTPEGFTVDGEFYREDGGRHEVYGIRDDQITLKRASKLKELTTAR